MAECCLACSRSSQGRVLCVYRSKAETLDGEDACIHSTAEGNGLLAPRASWIPSFRRPLSCGFQYRGSLALFRQLLTPFLGMNEHIVRIAEFLFPRDPRLAEPMHVAQFDVVQDAHHVLIDFGLQLLGIGLVEPSEL